jgi:hypothetical protein
MIRRTGSLLLLPIVVLLSVSVAAAQGLSPSSVMFTVAPGGSITEPKTINVPAKPPKADIEIAIDTTGSMGPSIAQAKADAVAIVTGVQGIRSSPSSSSGTPGIARSTRSSSR